MNKSMNREGALIVNDAVANNRRHSGMLTGSGGSRLLLLLLVSSTVLWAGQSVLARVLYGAGFTPMLLTTGRVIGSCLMAGLTVLIMDRRLLRVRVRDLPALLLYGVIAVALFSYLFLLSVQLVPVAVAVVLMYTGPIFMVLLSVPVFGDRLTAMRVCSLVLAVAGCFLVSGGLDASLEMNVTGILAGLGSGLCFAFLGVYGKLALRRMSEWTVLVYGQAMAAVLLLGLGGVTAIRTVEVPLWSWFVLLIAVALFLPSYWIFLTALKAMSPGVVGIVATLEPVWVAVLAFVIFSEWLSAGQIMGGLLVLGAVVLVERQTAGKESQ